MTSIIVNRSENPKLSFTSKNKKSEISNHSNISTISDNSQTQKETQKETQRDSQRSSRSDKKSKIGTYSSPEFQNWLNTPIQKPKMKRSKRTNDEAYQVFQDFSERMENLEWKAFFLKLYTGKFPHGYSYRNQTLFFRKRTKIEKLDLQDSSNDTLSKVMNFFEIYGGFNNTDDNLNIFDYLVSHIEPYRSWKDIRSKKTKQFFIQKYADDMEVKYHLSLTEKKCLLDTIHTGFLIRSIDSGDIEFEDKKITNIKTLNWLEERRDFVLIENVKNQRMSRKATSEKVSKNSFSAHWTKFLSQIIKDKPFIDDISTDVSMADDLTDTTISFSITE
jgi:hypothetical protein